ncbi:MAG: hypothetical protein COW65_04275 [Cytophagales bacterium CG18_big_fil_WC_8_21_14_2_50_42_9]|nr:MAG: hypothetical protein COW65_04275 [Cytophagales bacterium CG18_big_fil_WC_8_21_14_2_50_42_9]
MIVNHEYAVFNSFRNFTNESACYSACITSCQAASKIEQRNFSLCRCFLSAIPINTITFYNSVSKGNGIILYCKKRIDYFLVFSRYGFY